MYFNLLPPDWKTETIEASDKEENMAKYSKAAQDKIGETMHEYKEGELKDSHGNKVKDRKQAVAIGISEARQDGKKVPANKQK